MLNPQEHLWGELTQSETPPLLGCLCAILNCMYSNTTVPSPCLDYFNFTIYLLNHKAIVTYLHRLFYVFLNLDFLPPGAPLCSIEVKSIWMTDSVNMKSTECKCGCGRRDEQVATPELLQWKQAMAEFTPSRSPIQHTYTLRSTKC